MSQGFLEVMVLNFSKEPFQKYQCLKKKSSAWTLHQVSKLECLKLGAGHQVCFFYHPDDFNVYPELISWLLGVYWFLKIFAYLLPVKDNIYTEIYSKQKHFSALENYYLTIHSLGFPLREKKKFVLRNSIKICTLWRIWFFWSVKVSGVSFGTESFTGMTLENHSLQGWNGRGEGASRGRENLYIYIYVCISMYIKLWLICIVVQQKSTQHCKAVILHLKIL